MRPTELVPDCKTGATCCPTVFTMPLVVPFTVRTTEVIGTFCTLLRTVDTTVVAAWVAAPVVVDTAFAAAAETGLVTVATTVLALLPVWPAVETTFVTLPPALGTDGTVTSAVGTGTGGVG